MKYSIKVDSDVVGMENEVDLSAQALKNIESSILKDYFFENDDLKVLSNWTYLGMFLYEAQRSLLLSKDFNDKMEFVELDDSILVNGMFKNAILSYSKCFSQSSGGKISLDAKVVFSAAPELESIHGKMMDIRNSFIAHNGTNESDIAMIGVIEDEMTVELAQTYTISTPLGDFDDFMLAICHVENWVIGVFNKKVDKIQAKIGKVITFK